MTDNTIRTLIINSDLEQYKKLLAVLDCVNSASYELTWCADYSYALEAMLSNVHDVILLDFEHAPKICAELLSNAKNQDCITPIICLTHAVDRHLDTFAIQEGAADYLPKSNLNANNLERTIRYAIDRKANEAQLSKLAHYDLLTGIPNRRLFDDCLDRALQRVSRGDAPFALLYIDLDGFKAVNDAHGHDVGDLLVKGVAQRLEGCIRRIDRVARVGGDEFIVLLERIKSTNDAMSSAQKIISVVTEPFNFGGKLVRVGCSIGIAVYPSAGEDANSLIRHADMAMYEAKGIAGSNYRFYSSKMNEEAIEQEKLKIELQQAIDEDKLELYYQPRISLRTGKIVAVEALLRWEHAEHGLLLPNDFLRLAKQVDLIEMLGYWTLNRLCSDMQKMTEAKVPPLRFSLNVSAAQITAENFSETVSIILANNKINPDRLEFEIAETDLLKNIVSLKREMLALHEKGLHFLLDNYGSGVSSLPQLQQMPFDGVKIDMQHVSQIGEENAEKIIRAMVSLAHDFGIKAIASGVETAEQKEFLENLHCDQVQGFVYAAPQALDDFLVQLKKSGVTSRRSYLSVIEDNN